MEPELRTAQAGGADASIRTLACFDPDGMRTVLQQGAIEHVQVGPGRFRGQVAHTATSGMRLDWGRYTLALQARGDLGPDMLTVGYFAAGQGDWRLFGAPVHNGDLVLLPEGGEVQICVPPGAQWLSMQLSRARLEATGIDLAQLRGAGGWQLPRTRPAGLQEAVLATAPGLAPPLFDTDADGGAVDLEQLHAELCSRLLTELDWRMLDLGRRQPLRLERFEAWRTVSRAEDYLNARADLRVRIDELCAATACSIAKLDRAFLQVYGMGPQRCLLLRRLSRARRELLGGGRPPGQGVTAVAAHWGFAHLGRFSMAYKAVFGESPSQTLRRARR